MQISENFSLVHFNSFGLQVRARQFVTCSSASEIAEAVSLSGSNMILGGGSNILFTKDFEGLVIHNNIGGLEIVREEENDVFVCAGAGILWQRFVSFCIDHELAGAENLSLIPGNCGAAPMQNIGAYGAELKDIFFELEAFDCEDRKVVRFSKTDCAFGYRESVFKNRLRGRFVILNVTFQLNRKPVFNTAYGAIETELSRMGVHELSLRAVSDAVINIRRSKLPDPAQIGNAGSFFKNPLVSNEQFAELSARFPGIVGYPSGGNETKLAAGWLIEDCGWKGFRRCDAGCHERQALVLVNYGNATGNEILQLSRDIINSVKDKFEVQLQPEVNVI